MGPRGFVTCHVCGREFGSNSINLHEPKCLKRQLETGETNIETWTCDKCDVTIPAIRQADHSDTCKGSRPNTRTLERSTPEITEESEKIERPQTKTLKKPTPNISHPVIGDVDDVEKTKKKNQENTQPKPKRKYYRERKFAVKKPANTKVESKSIPSPCNSCNRSVAPERLHSHVPNINGTRVNVMTRSTEDGYVSDKESNKTKTKKKSQDTAVTVEDSGGSKGPRALICYICGRPFGSKSLPLHEPHCLERWKRENELLSPNQRRPLPQKPETNVTMTKDEFNEASWQSFQANLVPCPNCGRTFFPERLLVHQRVCKETGNKNNNNNVNKAHSNHSQLPPQSPITQSDIQLVQDSSKEVSKIPLATCYICGRLFGSKSISIHEPQCLKKWRIENEKLPPHMKRPEPEKPALMLNEDGTLNMDAMIEAAWQSHLQQLVPCPRCGRTFYPDRLMIHERSCKGKKSTESKKD
ncbi:zinc finger protein 474-like isoform X1 [Centruroides sculpturatus]|uniref:zinc finger protein 474-like isoform X1 n=1 Tax=Centruroides sculpturatus TaxID=218467 RepID=UPI000C6DE07A|nr:zinc finger protein 474-like isoform X1 [Centruroides sculpturatus]